MRAIIFLYNFAIAITGVIIFLCYFLVFEGKSRENDYFQNRISIVDETERFQIKIKKISGRKISYFALFVFFIMSIFPKKEWIL